MDLGSHHSLLHLEAAAGLGGPLAVHESTHELVELRNLGGLPLRDFGQPHFLFGPQLAILLVRSGIGLERALPHLEHAVTDHS